MTTTAACVTDDVAVGGETFGFTEEVLHPYPQHERGEEDACAEERFAKGCKHGSAAESGETHEGQGQDACEDERDCGPLGDVGYVCQFEFFAHTRHNGQGEGESRTGADSVYEALDEVVFFLGLE